VTLKTGVMMLKIQLFHHRNKHLNIYSNRIVNLNCNKIALFIFIQYFDQINAALVSIRVFFSKTKKLLNGSLL